MVLLGSFFSAFRLVALEDVRSMHHCCASGIATGPGLDLQVFFLVSSFEFFGCEYRVLGSVCCF